MPVYNLIGIAVGWVSPEEVEPVIRPDRPLWEARGLFGCFNNFGPFWGETCDDHCNV